MPLSSEGSRNLGTSVRDLDWADCLGRGGQKDGADRRRNIRVVRRKRGLICDGTVNCTDGL